MIACLHIMMDKSYTMNNNITWYWILT